MGILPEANIETDETTFKNRIHEENPSRKSNSEPKMNADRCHMKNMHYLKSTKFHYLFPLELSIASIITWVARVPKLVLQ